MLAKIVQCILFENQLFLTFLVLGTTPFSDPIQLATGAAICTLMAAATPRGGHLPPACMPPCVTPCSLLADPEVQKWR